MMGMKRQDKRKGSVMHKSQLQEYAQKAAIRPPVYEFVKEGASHEPRFKCIVTLNGASYESAPGFPNLKSAEHAAAKVALDALQQVMDVSGASLSPVHESGLCKNLLQEYAQKNSLPLPVYQSTRSGEDHAPTFTSSVEIAGVKYSGGSAKSKKEAEIKAAKTALLAIQSTLSSTVEAEVSAVTPAETHIGLSTFIESQVNNNNTAGRKRGRGAQASAEETPLRKMKIEPALGTPATKTVVEAPVEATPAETEDSAPGVKTPKPAKSGKKAHKSKVKEVADGESAGKAQTAHKSKVKEVADGESAGKASVPSDTSGVVKGAVKGAGIADLFATPTAKKILGVL